MVDISGPLVSKAIDMVSMITGLYHILRKNTQIVTNRTTQGHAY